MKCKYYQQRSEILIKYSDKVHLEDLDVFWWKNKQFTVNKSKKYINRFGDNIRLADNDTYEEKEK